MRDLHYHSHEGDHDAATAGGFLNVTKGVALHRDQIVHISDDDVYTMIDGSVFTA